MPFKKIRDSSSESGMVVPSVNKMVIPLPQFSCLRTLFNFGKVCPSFNFWGPSHTCYNQFYCVGQLSFRYILLCTIWFRRFCASFCILKCTFVTWRNEQWTWSLTRSFRTTKYSYGLWLWRSNHNYDSLERDSTYYCLFYWILNRNLNVIPYVFSYRERFNEVRGKTAKLSSESLCTELAFACYRSSE